VTHIYGDRRDLAAFRAEFREFAPQVVLDVICYTGLEALALMQTFRRLLYWPPRET
jgi:hypothetical protein